MTTLVFFDNAESMAVEAEYVEKLLTGFFTNEITAMQKTPQALLPLMEKTDQIFRIVVTIEPVSISI